MNGLRGLLTACCTSCLTLRTDITAATPPLWRACSVGLRTFLLTCLFCTWLPRLMCLKGIWYSLVTAMKEPRKGLALAG